jgi:hypothetical protein
MANATDAAAKSAREPGEVGTFMTDIYTEHVHSD